MPIPVTISESPLVFDTLPALKVRHYLGESRRGNIYTFARMYFWQGSLALSLRAFEQTPDPASRVEFAFCGFGSDILLLRLTPGVADLSLFKAGGRIGLEPPAPAMYRGEDEQGWFWGAELALAPPVLEAAGFVAGAGATFSAAVYKTAADEEAFGASFAAREADPYDPAGFDRFVAVDY